MEELFIEAQKYSTKNKLPPTLVKINKADAIRTKQMIASEKKL